MRILGVGEYHSLGEMYRRLMLEGHEVRVFVEEPEAQGIFAGIVSRCESYAEGIDWLREAGDDGIVVFESASKGEWQEALRRDGIKVIGSSVWGDRLENDRAFGQQVLRDAGLQTAATFDFQCFDAAMAFVRERPARYVYKPGGRGVTSQQTYIGELEDGSDLLAWLQNERDGAAGSPASNRFVLMQHLEGVEIGIGGYFDGTRFLEPLCLDWEHKRFFPGNLGEMTGEMGTLVTYRGYEPLFAATLAKLIEPLRAGGYLGYINLNTIINEDGVWPLEFTTRFGYPGYAICGALHVDGWGTIFRKMLSGGDETTSRFATHDGYAIGVVLTVPPFPYESGYEKLSKGAPIYFRKPLSEVERNALWYGEVAMSPLSRLVTDGSLGYVMVATGVGTEVSTACEAAYEAARNVVVRNIRYRNDIGENFMQRDEAILRRLGWLR